ncbi:hypothetical protein LSH36_325g04093, partial [Paralvinella palmiformis]
SLVDSLGHAYILKVDKRHPGTTWRCAVRSKTLTCKATVLVREASHTSAMHSQTRQTVLEVRRDVKSIAVKRVFTSATDLVYEAYVTSNLL